MFTQIIIPNIDPQLLPSMENLISNWKLYPPLKKCMCEFPTLALQCWPLRKKKYKDFLKKSIESFNSLSAKYHRKEGP